MAMGSLHGGGALEISSAKEAEFCLRASGKRPPSSEHSLTRGSMSRLRIPGSFESRHARAMAASASGFRRLAGPAQREAAARASTVEMVASSPSGMRLSALADALPGGRPATRAQQRRPRSQSSQLGSPVRGDLRTWAAEEERVQMLRALAAEPTRMPAGGCQEDSLGRPTAGTRRRHDTQAASTKLLQSRGTGALFDPRPRFLDPPAGSSDRYLIEGQRTSDGRGQEPPGSPSRSNGFNWQSSAAGVLAEGSAAARGTQARQSASAQQLRLQAPKPASILLGRARAETSPHLRVERPPGSRGPLVRLPAQGLVFVRDAVTPVTEQVRAGRIRPGQVLRAGSAAPTRDTLWRRNEELPDPRARQLGRCHVARALLQSRLAARLGSEAHSMDLGPAFFVHGGWEQASNHGLPFSPLRDSPTLRQGTFYDAESSRGDVALGASQLNLSSRRGGGVPSTASRRSSAMRASKAEVAAGSRPWTSAATTRTRSDSSGALFEAGGSLASPLRLSSADMGQHERKEMEAFEQRHQRKAITDLTSGELATLLLENERELPLAGLTAKAIREHLVCRDDLIQAAVHLGVGPPLGDMDRRPNMDPMDD